jgi:hypothetical protein
MRVNSFKAVFKIYIKSTFIKGSIFAHKAVLFKFNFLLKYCFRLELLLQQQPNAAFGPCAAYSIMHGTRAACVAVAVVTAGRHLPQAKSLNNLASVSQTSASPSGISPVSADGYSVTSV